MKSVATLLFGVLVVMFAVSADSSVRAEDDLREFQIANKPNNGCKTIPDLARYRDMRRDCEKFSDNVDFNCKNEVFTRSCQKLDAKTHQKEIAEAIEFGTRCVEDREKQQRLFTSVQDAIRRDKGDNVLAKDIKPFENEKNELLRLMEKNWDSHEKDLNQAKEVLQECKKRKP